MIILLYFFCFSPWSTEIKDEQLKLFLLLWGSPVEQRSFTLTDFVSPYPIPQDAHWTASSVSFQIWAILSTVSVLPRHFWILFIDSMHLSSASLCFASNGFSPTKLTGSITFFISLEKPRASTLRLKGPFFLFLAKPQNRECFYFSTLAHSAYLSVRINGGTFALSHTCSCFHISLSYDQRNCET